MYWKRLIVSTRSDCPHRCAACAWQKAPSRLDRSLRFFEEALSRATAVPVWEFICLPRADGEVDDFEALVNCANRLGHSYQVATYHENLTKLDAALWGRRPLTVFFHEDAVPESKWTEFYRTLAWARDQEANLTVRVGLSERLLPRLRQGSLFQWLLELADHVDFVVPKIDGCRVSPDQFMEFTDFICRRLLNSPKFGKVELDSCLLPAMSPMPAVLQPCPYQTTLILSPDGRLRSCPDELDGDVLATGAEIERYVEAVPDESARAALQTCRWRRAWSRLSENTGIPHSS